MAAGNSGKRRTTTRKKTTASRKTTAKRKEENAFIRDEVTVLILFAVSVLLLISNFGVGGAAGSFVSGVMFCSWLQRFRFQTGIIPLRL